MNAALDSGLLSEKGTTELKGLTSTAQAVSSSGGFRNLAAAFVDKTLRSDSAANSATSLSREVSPEAKSGSRLGIVKDFLGSETKRDGLNQVADLAIKSNLISGTSKDALTVGQGLVNVYD